MDVWCRLVIHFQLTLVRILAWTNFFFLALTLCSPIDGATRIFISFFLHFGNADPYQLLCPVPLFAYHLRPEWEKNHMNIATQPIYASSGNQIWAASTASESAIHYTIASRLLLAFFDFNFRSFKVKTTVFWISLRSRESQYPS